jgi:AraC-like DNA-binding protein
MNTDILPNAHVFSEVFFPPGGYEPPRILFDNQLVYVSEGKNDITIGSEKYVVSAGKALIIPPGIAHFSENVYDAPARRHNIHFDWSGTRKKPDKLYVFLRGGQKPPAAAAAGRPFFFTLSPDLAPLMGKTLSLLRSAPPDIIALRYTFGELLCRVVSEKSPAAGKREAAAWGRMSVLSALKQYIDSHYAEDIGYGDFCAETRRSAAWLCARFKNFTGMSPTDYLITVRLSHAERLLESSPLTIDEICGRVGIQDHNYFSRLFRKRNGLSPSEYRRRQSPDSPAIIELRSKDQTENCVEDSGERH